MTTASSAMEFNVALQTASYAESETSSVRTFKRDGEHIPFASFQPVGADAIEIKVKPVAQRDHRHSQIIGLINYFGDLFGVTLFVDVDDSVDTGKADISFFQDNGFLKGRRFDSGSVPLCRVPRSLL